MNLAAISGGRATYHGTGITLPVGQGYYVTIDLAANDTYVVRRCFKRRGVLNVKGEQTEVYAEEVGETAYVASCYVNREFGGHKP